MKKMIITCALVLAGASVYAQSPSVECRICSDMLSGWAKAKQADTVKRKETRQVNSLDTALRRAAVKKAREAKAEQEAAEASKKAGGVKENKGTASSYPAYLYGREGHMMALGEAVRHSAERKAAVKAKRNNGQKKDAAAPNKEEPSLLKAIFLGTRYPGESEEQYQTRLQVRGTAAGQPFK